MPPKADATDQLLHLRIPDLINTRIGAVSQIAQRREVLESCADDNVAPMCANTHTAADERNRLRSTAVRRIGENNKPEKECNMSIGTILLVVLVLMLVGVLPVWPHATSWGYGPSGIVGVLLIIIIVLFLMGRL